MRKYILVLALLLFGGFSLPAQFGPDASIFVTAVKGKGDKSEDNAFFYKQLTFEIASQSFNLAKTQRSSDFSLVGTIGPYRGFMNALPYEGQFAFHLELRNNKTGEMLAEGEFLYTDRDDARQQLPLLLSNLLYTIPADGFYPDSAPDGTPDSNPDANPDETGKNDDWRNKLLYLGLAGTWTPRFYIGNIDKNAGDDSMWYPGDPHFAFSAEFHFLDNFSMETGLEMSADYLVSGNEKYRNTIIELPVLLKYVLKPNSSFMFEPYVGARFNIPLFDKTYTFQPSRLSFLAGFQYAVKAGPGAVFIDARFAIDATKSNVKAPTTPWPEFQRYIVHLGLGCKFGIFRRDIK